MTQKRVVKSSGSSEKPIQERYRKFSRFVSNIVDQSGLRPYAFSRRYGVPNSSLREFMQSRNFPGPDKLVELAHALSQASGKKITPAELTALIDQPAEPDLTPKREILPSSTVLWHMQRLTREERGKIWSSIFKLAMGDWGMTGEPDPPALHPILQAISHEMQKRNLKTLPEFFDEVMALNKMFPDHEERVYLENFLQPDKPLEEQSIPENWGVLHGRALVLLAKVLEGGKLQPTKLNQLYESALNKLPDLDSQEQPEAEFPKLHNDS